MMPRENYPTRRGPAKTIATALLLALTAAPAMAAGSKGKSITPTEIAMYVGIIVGLMIFAWWLATRDKKSEDEHHASVSKHHQGHHHHSNDPYFKRSHKR